MATPPTNGSAAKSFDIIIVGGGFGGCYLLHRLRKLGFSIRLIEAGSSLGGVWHWNRYPGARVDSEIPYYQYTLREVWRDFTWSQRFPSHDELKSYFAHVDRALDLSRDVQYSTAVTGAQWDPKAGRWTVQTNNGYEVTCRFLLPATGSSYKRHEPDFLGMRTAFRGVVAHAAAWPEGGIDYTSKKVAIIGAGATGLQVVQEMSKTAGQTMVYIRQPNIALPMGQRELTPLEQRAQKAVYGGLFKLAKAAGSGIAGDVQSKTFGEMTTEEREEMCEELWGRGGFGFQSANVADFLVNDEANRALYDFWARKTRARISDPAKRDIVAPLERPYPFATKRSSLEQDYYECIDRVNVEVVSLKKTPIREFFGKGIATEDGTEREHDIVVLATGYDNMTGSLTSMDLRGTDGIDLKEREMFKAPTAFSNAPMFIESQADLIIEFLARLRNDGVSIVEPTAEAQEGWAKVIQDISDMTLFRQVKDSWYVGGNIPGKKREQLNYLGGMDRYAEVVSNAFKNYSNFRLSAKKSCQKKHCYDAYL
ncbi:Baeyer-Villiger monooxygenase 4 [Phialemonium atrogriseum]|uniref:Baeyer-Villiger monooxygenase 4 n=1 Tax=Phialemonium atrogriseum TaxID=1093897 RepID=A0AAJ0BU39_9PEZI|nr:Baeyer-Villiger monooxygenase 4 [Phialemonium atrogriseum]KAK1764529.1 Baeyer-Villiger monooxygenase 4 [Phialemonium atrogriseum]